MAYTEAPDVEQYGNCLIENLLEFEHLIDKPIAYCYTDKQLRGGRASAVCMKAPSPWKGDGLADFKIIVHGPSWQALTGDQRQALVHHELMHCAYETVKKKSGVFIVPKIRSHDVEEFIETRRRYGDWDQTRKDYVEVQRETVKEAIMGEANVV